MGEPIQSLFSYSHKKLWMLLTFLLWIFFLPWRVSMWESRVLTCSRSFGTITERTRSGSGNSLITPIGNGFSPLFQNVLSQPGEQIQWPSEKGQPGPTKKCSVKTKPGSGFMWKLLNLLHARQLRDCLQESTESMPYLPSSAKLFSLYLDWPGSLLPAKGRAVSSHLNKFFSKQGVCGAVQSTNIFLQYTYKYTYIDISKQYWHKKKTNFNFSSEINHVPALWVKEEKSWFCVLSPWKVNEVYSSPSFAIHFTLLLFFFFPSKQDVFFLDLSKASRIQSEKH